MIRGAGEETFEDSSSLRVRYDMRATCLLRKSKVIVLWQIIFNQVHNTSTNPNSLKILTSTININGCYKYSSSYIVSD